MRMGAFETYQLFLALKNHFTRDSYDFFKYRGKTNASNDSFLVRKDRFQFQKLARKYSPDQMQDFIVSNLIVGRSWVGDFLDDEAHDNYMLFLKRKQSLTYTFENDLDRLFTASSPESAFRVKDGQIPPVVSLLMTGAVSPETFVVLDRFIGFSKVFDEQLKDDFIWSKYRMLATKFRPFLSYDKDKMLRILKEKIHDHSGEEHETSQTSAKEIDETYAEM